MKPSLKYLVLLTAEEDISQWVVFRKPYFIKGMRNFYLRTKLLYLVMSVHRFGGSTW